DAGGSNGCRPRLWKRQLQDALSDAFGLEVTVGHYPTGCSKYNPIEHRLFGPISLNWAGQPLRTWDALLAFLRGTSTTTGLAVRGATVAWRRGRGAVCSRHDGRSCRRPGRVGAASPWFSVVWTLPRRHGVSLPGLHAVWHGEARRLESAMSQSPARPSRGQLF